ncbi:macro domain-containing protein [Candidatus Woesebacteria bacterium]|nr:macro domain-containing protein [Candidatus Woesebacteria bacterium]
MTIQVILRSGDITTDVPVDCLISSINSEGLWFGGVDEAIRRVAGDQFHSQALQMLRQYGLYDGQVLPLPQKQQHRGSFHCVLFVVDDLQQPLKELVFNALKKAEACGFRSVALPMMRTGVAAGIVERTQIEVVQAVKIALLQFLIDYPYSNMQINVVAYGIPSAIRLFLI